MSARTTVYVRAIKSYAEWIEVQAVTLAEAEAEVREMPGVIDTVDSTYEKPEPE
jgi:hypothetical protein